MTPLVKLPWPLLAVVTLIMGCAEIEPDVGPLLAGNSCNNQDLDPATSVSFAAQIRPLMNRPNGMGGCSCHLPTSAGPGTGTQLSGLDLGSMVALRQGGNVSGLRIVIEGEPCSSVIYEKVSSAPPFGSRMPLNGPPFLTTAEINLVHDWIAEGAIDN